MVANHSLLCSLILYCSHAHRRLDGLPLYGMGISSGGSFVLKMPRLLKVGISLESIGLPIVSDRCSGLAAGPLGLGLGVAVTPC